MSLGPGSTLGPFKIQSLIGKGGMGEVFSAIDTRLDRRVAIKILPPDFTNDSDRLRRFESEAKMLASLNHPNILVIHEVGTDGTPYLVSELLQGSTLRQELGGKSLPTRKALDYAVQVANGVATAAHARGIIHRDLKPENIFITKDGHAKILDFGLAKSAALKSPISNLQSSAPTLVQSTVPGLILGTPAYMSPEQVRGDAADHRSDIFAFGCVLYEMLIGTGAFRRDSALETMNAILKEDAPELNTSPKPLPPSLIHIVERCLEKNPDQRFQSTNDLSFAIAQLNSVPSAQGQRYLARQIVPFLALGGLLIIATALFLLKIRSANNSSTDRSLGPANSLSQLQKSVAILPFLNLSADKADDYLSDGMTEELLNALAKVKGLRVPGRSSSFAFKGHAEEGLYRKIAEQLNVGSVLEGSIRKAGEKLRVSARLINLSNGSQLWAETYDHDMTNIFAIQSEIATRVGEALQVQLLGSPTRQPTQNIEAYKLYLQARYLWNRRTGEAILRAVELFNQALAADPNFALAWAGLADCYSILDEYAGIPPSETQPKARAAALKAIELDGNLAEPHAALAAHKAFYEWDWASAETEFQRAIALNPNYATSYHWYGNLLRSLQQFDEAVRQTERAREIDPLAPILACTHAYNLFAAGQHEAAIQVVEKQLALTPEFPSAHYGLGDYRLQQGKVAEAIPELEKALELAPKYLHIQGRLGFAYARAGRTNDAQRVLNRLIEFQNNGQEASYDIALVYLGLGNNAEALAWLERAVAHHYLADEIVTTPYWQNLRDQPRVQALLRKMNLGK